MAAQPHRSTMQLRCFFALTARCRTAGLEIRKMLKCYN